MPRSSRALPARPWNIHSVYVRRRDGPQRVERAYLLLLGDPPSPNNYPTERERRESHACSNLRPGVHGTSGARADD